MDSHTQPAFLRYDEVTDRPSGMHNQLTNLQWLMREAFLCGRLAVLPALKLHPRHNFDRLDGCGSWDTYFDLGASRLIDPAGNRQPLPIAPKLPERAVRTLTLRPRERLPEDARRFELVVRSIRDFAYVRDLPYDRARRLLGDVLAGPTGIGFEMQPASQVRELADQVVDAITSRCGTYPAVHIRRGDRLQTHPVVKRRTEPVNIRARLRELGVRDGDPVFFLSDERDPRFWRALGRYYQIVRYTDFPQLTALVDGKGKPDTDNYLLYEVEKAIMRRAAVRVETIPGPNYTPSHATLISRREWIRANMLSSLRRTARRLKRAFRNRGRAGVAWRLRRLLPM